MSEQKVWVEKMPNSCGGCKFFDEHRRQCELELCFQWSEEKRKYNDCPLQSLYDHDKELVAEVLEKVKKELDGDYNQYRINYILDQIQKEFEK